MIAVIAYMHAAGVMFTLCLAKGTEDEDSVPFFELVLLTFLLWPVVLAFYVLDHWQQPPPISRHDGDVEKQNAENAEN